jgi:hypothetical protein
MSRKSIMKVSQIEYARFYPVTFCGFKPPPNKYFPLAGWKMAPFNPWQRLPELNCQLENLTSRT